MISVRNNTSNKFASKYDGIEYIFPVGEDVVVPMDAASHIFGLGLSDKTEVLVRHGWLQKSDEKDKAMQILNGFAFTAVNMVPVPADAIASDVTEQGSAPLQREEGGQAVSDGTAQPSDSVPRNLGGMLGNIGR